MTVQNASIDGTEYDSLSEWWVDVQLNYDNTEPYTASGFESSHDSGAGGTEYLADNLAASGLSVQPSSGNDILITSAPGQNFVVSNADGSANCIHILQLNTSVQQFKVQNRGTTNGRIAVLVSSSTGYAKNMIVEGYDLSNRSSLHAFSISTLGGRVINCLAISKVTSALAYGFYSNSPGSEYLNCGAVSDGGQWNNGFAANNTNTNRLFINCYSLDSASQDWSPTALNGPTIENCGSADSSVDGRTGSFTGLVQAAFTNYAGGNYVPATGNQLDGNVNPGQTNPSSFSYTDDITGAERTVPWEIGPYEITAAGPTPPIVDAGGPYSGDVGTPIQLSGDVQEGSDPTPTLLWTIVSGGTGTFSDDSIVNPTFTPDQAGPYVLRLSADPDDGDPVTSDANLTSNAVAIQEFHVRDGAAWKQATPYLKVNGAWEEVDGFVKDAGVWKPVHEK